MNTITRELLLDVKSKHGDISALNLSDNAIEGLENLELLPTLKRLDVRSNTIRTLDNLSALSRLEELLASDNFISSLGPSVASLKNLRVLDLADNELSDAAPLLDVLSQLPALTELHIKGNPVVLKETFLETLLGACPTLRILDGEPIPTADSDSDSGSDHDDALRGPTQPPSEPAAASAERAPSSRHASRLSVHDPSALIFQDLSAIDAGEPRAAGVGFATVTATPFESVEVNTRSPEAPPSEGDGGSDAATEASVQVRSLRSSIQTRTLLLKKEKDALEEHMTHLSDRNRQLETEVDTLRSRLYGTEAGALQYKKQAEDQARLARDLIISLQSRASAPHAASAPPAAAPAPPSPLALTTLYPNALPEHSESPSHVRMGGDATRAISEADRTRERADASALASTAAAKDVEHWRGLASMLEGLLREAMDAREAEARTAADAQSDLFALRAELEDAKLQLREQERSAAETRGQVAAAEAARIRAAAESEALRSTITALTLQLQSAKLDRSEKGTSTATGRSVLDVSRSEIDAADAAALVKVQLSIGPSAEELAALQEELRGARAQVERERESATALKSYYEAALVSVSAALPPPIPEPEPEPTVPSSNEFPAQISALEDQARSQSDRIAALEAIVQLQEESLAAAISPEGNEIAAQQNARHLAVWREKLMSLCAAVSGLEAAQAEFTQDAEKKAASMRSQLREKATIIEVGKQREKDLRAQLDLLQSRLKKAESALSLETARSTALQSDVDSLQSTGQQLLASLLEAEASLSSQADKAIRLSGRVQSFARRIEFAESRVAAVTAAAHRRHAHAVPAAAASHTPSSRATASPALAPAAAVDPGPTDAYAAEVSRLQEERAALLARVIDLEGAVARETRRIAAEAEGNILAATEAAAATRARVAEVEALLASAAEERARLAAEGAASAREAARLNDALERQRGEAQAAAQRHEDEVAKLQSASDGFQREASKATMAVRQLERQVLRLQEQAIAQENARHTALLAKIEARDRALEALRKERSALLAILRASAGGAGMPMAAALGPNPATALAPPHHHGGLEGAFSHSESSLTYRAAAAAALSLSPQQGRGGVASAPATAPPAVVGPSSRTAGLSAEGSSLESRIRMLEGLCSDILSGSGSGSGGGSAEQSHLSQLQSQSAVTGAGGFPIAAHGGGPSTDLWPM